ncbi:MAG TPA: alanine--glyoxylate aminotransferase family protein, partial [Dehalococcoidia bacterium]|nr:alanine--glyoxylate aminotransferase family protein [Dehalococcoidia bacterium]
MGEWPTAVINPPVRILMGPGPSPVHPRIYRAMTAPMLGYQDPAFHQIMDEVKVLLRMLFDTGNELSFPVSGTGSAGMETAVCNSLEPGDHIVVGINGFFAGRIAEMARRVGAEVTLVEAEWGSIVEPQALKAALDQHPNTKVVALVHGETSTGVLQPMDEIARLVKEHDVLLILDTVTSLGGCPVDVDAWQVDFCYSGSQKCLNVPPGLAPLTVSSRGVAAIKARTHPVVNWYLDLSLIQNYWNQSRAYHHTPPVSMIYALREGLALIAEEGLKPRFQRHIRNARALYAGLEAMGLQLFVPQAHRLPSLTTVRVPEGVDDARVRGALLA